MNQSIDTPKLNRAQRRIAKHRAQQIKARGQQLAKKQKPPRELPDYPSPNPKFVRDEMTVIENQNFRDGTSTNLRDIVFKFMLPNRKSAALGDMICWLPAIKYIAENYNFVCGHLIVPGFFVEIAQNVLGKYSHWKIHADVIPDFLLDGYPLNEQVLHPVNATGMNLVDLGFIYFVHTAQVPVENKFYVELDLGFVEPKPEILFHNLAAKKYAVMTPLAEAHTRTMLPSVFNAIQDHLISIGITPVYIGKEEMKGRHLGLDPRLDLTKGINLLNKTTLLEAAKIMRDSQMVIGIDNGLLHLAATTDATILYGYTIAGPAQRRPYRRHGHLYELYADKEKLKCLFCQETTKFINGHNFEDCLYKENEPQCITALNSESWIATIDLALKEKADGT